MLRLTCTYIHIEMLRLTCTYIHIEMLRLTCTYIQASPEIDLERYLRTTINNVLLSSVNVLSCLHFVGKTLQVLIQTSKQLKETKEKQLKLDDEETLHQPTDGIWWALETSVSHILSNVSVSLAASLASTISLWRCVSRCVRWEGIYLIITSLKFFHHTDFSFSGEETSCLLRSLSLCFHFSKSLSSSACTTC